MIVVTGGAGFIGCCLVKYLNELGYFDVIVVDELGQSDKWKNLLKISFKDFIHKDDFFQKFNKLPTPKLIFHLGANSSTRAQDGDYLLRNNYEYTKELCRLCLNREAKFIYASSAATYGAGENGYQDLETGLVRLKPLNLYGYSKHLFDLFAQRNNLFDRYQIIGLKYFNVYGPAEDHKGDMRSVILKAYHSYLDTGKVTLFKSNHSDFEDGEQKRDFIYVKDAVKLTWYLANHPSGLGGIYNIGSGVANSFNSLVGALAGALGKDIIPEYIDMPLELQANYQYFTQADNKKLKATEIESYPLPKSHSLTAGIFDYVQNYMQKNKFTMSSVSDEPSET